MDSIKDSSGDGTPIRIFTIGFTKKNAETFFTMLKDAKVKRVIDIRLNNESQLAGFTKKGDLEFFLKAIGDMDYIHCPDLAPTREMLEGYRRKEITWAEYQVKFRDLLISRRAEALFQPSLLDGACLLCSEAGPQRCHRSLVAEYLREKLKWVEIKHL